MPPQQPNLNISKPSYLVQWDLVCDKGYLSETTQSILVFGVLVGAFLMTNASDRFGRKPVFIVNAVLVCLSLLLSAWANSLLVFNVLRFFTGMFQQVGTMWLFSIYLFTTCFIIDMACYGDIYTFFCICFIYNMTSYGYISYFFTTSPINYLTSDFLVVLCLFLLLPFLIYLLFFLCISF